MTSEKLQIVLFAANPLGDLKLDEEIRSIEEGIRESRYRDLVSFVSALATRPGDLISKLGRYQPEVVQFSGHGEGGAANGAGSRSLTAGPGGQIILVDSDGAPRPVSQDALTDLFRYRRGNIRLVVLNACSTRPEAEAIRQVIDCVVGTKKEIGDLAARVFAARFYQTLSDGGSVQQAFDDARTELKLQGIPESNTPVLLARDGVVPANVVLLAPESGRPRDDREQTGRLPVHPAIVGEAWRWAVANRVTLGLVLGASAVLAAAPFGLAKHLQAWTDSEPLSYALLIAPLAAVIALNVIPDFWAKRKARRLLDVGVFGNLKAPGFFRIHPYGDSPQDRKLFERADQMHVEVLQWLRTTREPLLYLTGRSGTGKSSLLYAYVLPELREGSPPVPQVIVRAFHEPLDVAMRRELLNIEGLKAEPSAQSADLRSLLALACQKLGGKLVVVFDQFEEFLIISDRDPALLTAFKGLVTSLNQDPIPGLKILVVMRSDYLGWLQKLDLPPMRPRENWTEIGAFRASDARAFLARSGLTIGKQLLDDLVSQLAEIEQSHGLIRPITLNMVGLILDRVASADVPRIPEQVDRLLDRYLDDCIHDPDIRTHAPAIVGEMITRVGTIRPRPVAELASATKLDPYVVSGVLLNLGNRGLVRRVDQAGNIWEVAHDFVAQRLRDLLRPTLLQRVRPWIAPAIVLAGCIAVAASFLVPRGGGVYRTPQFPEVNLAGKLPPVRDQGPRSLSTTFAMTALHEYSLIRRGNRQYLSAEYLYFMQKQRDGYPGKAESTLKAAAGVLADVGQCRESVWPFDPTLADGTVGTKPPEADTDAAKYKLHTWKLDPTDVLLIKAALRGGSPVAIDFPVFQEVFDEPHARKGIIPDTIDMSPIGGIAVCLIGYKDDPGVPGGGSFILQHSWGTDWGAESGYGRGFGTISYNYIAIRGEEAYALRPEDLENEEATGPVSIVKDTSKLVKDTSKLIKAPEPNYIKVPEPNYIKVPEPNYIAVPADKAGKKAP